MQSRKHEDNSIVNQTTINLFLLLTIFVFGLVSQTILNFRVANYIAELDAEVRNAEIENVIGQEIILEIYKLESSFFQMSTFPNIHLRNILQNEINENANEIEHALKILNIGGTYSHYLDLNLPNTPKQQEVLYYSPLKTNQFSFVEADIMPKIKRVFEKIQQINSTLDQIDHYRLTKDDRLSDALSELKLEVKLFKPIFQRIKEDANHIIHSNSINFAKIRSKVESQKLFYKNLQISLTLFLLIFGLLAFWALSRNIHRTSVEIENSRNYTQDILNSQENIIIVNDGEKLIDASGGFFNFFSEYETLESFSKDYTCICDLFVKEEGLVYKFSDKNWIEYLLENPNVTHKAKIDYLGSIRTFQLSAQKSNRYQRYIVSLVDITNLEKINNDLNIEKNKALEATKSKGEFLANMSHEIRTPLNAILGFIDLLKGKKLDSESQKYLDTISQSSHTLLGIINDILDLSKIENGKLEIDRNDFSPKIEFNNVADLFRARCSEKNITFKVEFTGDLPDILHSDALRLKQVISNLLSNAVKFTDSGKNIDLMIDYSPGWLRIAIKDQGIGMSREAQEKIFEAFTQAETSTTRTYGGTGLGLTISARLVEMLGGNLKVTSKLGEGSTFYFSIPVQAAQQKVQEKTNATDNIEEVNFSGEILLVEDNLTNQMLMKAILKKLNLNCDLANDGLEAVEAVKNKRYDLILMDENMPNLNGIEATKQIRIYEQKEQIEPQAIVALTANAMTGDRERFISAGMDDYLTKPINMPELKRVFAEVLVKV
ncbi:response regulator [Thiomicrorhabdus sp. 6S2-11]|uniref:histidine kinase n=1 Tax=Thiomicrorhabdus marina TaxID=2818442 RepID=A0ABS3Q1Q6_9GAMM|nr:ATP-binding protein [Thiomicrorhabdus marina]MBO1926261.1 response regulator [Thiomicrorhabdus marina]